jgi:hypothetical protein
LKRPFPCRLHPEHGTRLVRADRLCAEIAPRLARTVARPADFSGIRIAAPEWLAVTDHVTRAAHGNDDDWD